MPQKSSRSVELAVPPGLEIPGPPSRKETGVDRETAGGGADLRDGSLVPSAVEQSLVSRGDGDGLGDSESRGGTNGGNEKDKPPQLPSNYRMNSPSAFHFESGDVTSLPDIHAQKLSDLLLTRIGQLLHHLDPYNGVLQLDGTHSVQDFLDHMHRRDMPHHRTAVVEAPLHSRTGGASSSSSSSSSACSALSGLCGRGRRRTTHSFVDIRDVVYRTMREIKRWKTKTWVEVLEMVSNMKASSVANEAGRTPFKGHSSNDTLVQIFEAFKTCTDVPLFENKELKRVVSAVDVLRLMQRTGLLDRIQDSQKRKLLARKKMPVSLLECDSLLKAVALMERQNFSAVPIASEKDVDKVVQIVTVRDVSALFYMDREALAENDTINQPVRRYVDFLAANHFRPRQPFSILASSASLHDMVEAICSPRKERIFVTSAAGKIEGMLTLSDMVWFFAEELGFSHKTELKKLNTIEMSPTQVEAALAARALQEQERAAEKEKKGKGGG